MKFKEKFPMAYAFLMTLIVFVIMDFIANIILILVFHQDRFATPSWDFGFFTGAVTTIVFLTVYAKNKKG